MNTKELIYEVFKEVFDMPDLVLADTMGTGDIEGWDSFKNVEILILCESKFQIELDANEIDTIKTIADLITTIEKKLSH
jgi:acyl carrier protein